jgi:hypothetical protein
MEQMMIQSAVNIQLEAFKNKKLLDYPIDISDLVYPNPKELQCFEFNIANIDLSFKKSQAQFSIYYKDMPKFVKRMDTGTCDKCIE